MNELRRIFSKDVSDLVSEMDRRSYVWIFFTLLTIALVSYAYYESGITAKQWSRAEEFSRNISLLENYSDRAEKQSSDTSKRIENPLSYLENQVQQENVGQLSPIGDEDQRKFRLTLEGVTAERIFALIKKLERQSQMTISELSIERVSMGSRTFDLRLEVNYHKAGTGES